MSAKKVVLGLSGGVDSAVAAQRLLEQGYAVHGLYLDIGLGGAEAAEANAHKLGIPLTVVPIGPSLEEHVCAPFAADYLSGRTPIPCARCNRWVKFPTLMNFAREIGADYVATGHYARIGVGTDGGPILLTGPSSNDQSYMLARLTREMLGSILFPLGENPKDQVRQEADAAQLPSAHRPDSMEICFIPDSDYAAWLDARGGTPPPGNFIDAEGNVLGTHKGFHHYTLGQRRGLGVSSTGRLFVTEIRPHSNEVVLSHGEGLHATQVQCEDLNWLGEQPLTTAIEVDVRLRHSRHRDPATVTPLGHGQVHIQMHRPARAPTPGQLAVFYRDDQVLGSGWIR